MNVKSAHRKSTKLDNLNVAREIRNFKKSYETPSLQHELVNLGELEKAQTGSMRRVQPEEECVVALPKDTGSWQKNANWWTCRTADVGIGLELDSPVVTL